MAFIELTREDKTMFGINLHYVAGFNRADIGGTFLLMANEPLIWVNEDYEVVWQRVNNAYRQAP